MNASDIQNILQACSYSHVPSTLADVILSIPVLNTAIRKRYIEKVEKECKALCLKKKGKPSVLRTGAACFNSLVKFRWETVLAELKEKAPYVYDVLVAVGVPSAPKSFDAGCSKNNNCHHRDWWLHKTGK